MNTRPATSKIPLLCGGRPKIDGYEILHEIGSGEWARVHLARHVRTGLVVACKTLRESVWHNHTIRKRFTREQAMAKEHWHPYILENLDAGTSHGFPYIIMPYCSGGNLEQTRQRMGGRLSAVDGFRLMLPAMEGLAALHARGHVHRDIKPQNILLDDRGISLLADFGLAKPIADAGKSGITSSSTIGIGSLGFMPPEQISNFRFLDARTDVWAAAATYSYLITGIPARGIGSFSDDFAGLLRRPVIPLRRRDATVSWRIAFVIDRALTNEIDARYANAASFWEALSRTLS